jgi:hypothetical protein
MMKQCFAKDGKPDLSKLKEYMEVHDCADRLDSVAWSLFFIWVGIAWIADWSLGVGLMGVAVIILTEQAVRKFFHLGTEGFWLIMGVGIGVGGAWELADLQIPLLPFLLISLGLSLMVWGRQTKRAFYALRHRYQKLKQA